MNDLTPFLIGAGLLLVAVLWWQLRRQKPAPLPRKLGGAFDQIGGHARQQELERGGLGAALRGWKRTVERALGRDIISFDTPYKLGDYQSNLSPVSLARLSEDGRVKTGIDYTMFVAGLLSAFGSDAAKSKLEEHQTTQNQPAKAKLSEQKNLQKLADARDYEPGRIQAEMAEMAARFPDRAGMSAKPAEDNLPTQVIYGANGEVLMKGKAASVEHLIAQKLDEAAKATDPSKKVVNLAGAQLDEKATGQKLNFERFNFQNVDLRGANLQGANFKDCQFKNVEMAQANLKGASLDMCHMDKVNMAGFVGDKNTSLKNSTMQNVDMSNAHAPEMKFERIRAEYINMQGSNFNGSSWTDVKVENLHARDIKLEGARLGRVDITGQHSTLEGAKLNNAHIANSSFGTYEKGINMSRMEARNTTWSDVNFTRSDLSRSDFTGAGFTRTDMRHVTTINGPMNMSQANLSGLAAGSEAKLRANDARIDGVTMRPERDFVFNGTAPLHRAADAALKAGENIAHVIGNDGATREAFKATMTAEQQQRLQQQRRMALNNSPRPPSPYDKKNSGGY